MKWFKHDSDASIDSKIERLILRYGAEGYGLYFFCLELVARNVEAHNLTFELEHDAEIIGHRLGMHRERVEEMMTFMVEQGLFENRAGVIFCPKMETRTDEYTQKLLKKKHGVSDCPDTIPTLSRQAPDKVRINRREEKRLEREGQNRKRFMPPSLEELSAYIAEKNYTVSPHSFIAFYSSKGWMVGKNKMKCWRSAVTQWQLREKQNTHEQWPGQAAGVSRNAI